MKKQSLEKDDNEHCSGRKSVIVGDPVDPQKRRNLWKIAVLGAGSWGTALAVHSSLAGHNVRLWARRQLAADAMSRSGKNADYLPRCELPESLVVSADAEASMADADLVRVVGSELPTLMREFPLEWGPRRPDSADCSASDR